MSGTAGSQCLLHPDDCDLRRESGAGAPPPRYAWTAVLIKDIVQSWLQAEIHEVLITVPGEAILFFGWRSEKQGLTREQAQDLATYFPAQRDWVGKKVAITARVINLFTARGYSHIAREYQKAKKTLMLSPPLVVQPKL